MSPRHRLIFPTICIMMIATATLRADPPLDVERSVVRITNYSQQPAWDSPWRWLPVQKWTGSGFVISGKRIMTNAHVVSWKKQLLVQRYQDSRDFLAHVEFVGHDCDLAVLKVDDPSFFDGITPLEFGPLPKVRSPVTTYGYPAGGEEISYTRGVVSRIEVDTYSHIGNRALLVAQTDAAINPGNSGGPVIQDDRVVGVAFQGYSGAVLQNTSFFIPPCIIEHFLKDIQDGTYNGFPLAGVNLQQLENPSYRKYLKLPDERTGARVDWVLPGHQQTLHEEDVILKVGAYPVRNDGTTIYEGNRVSIAAILGLAQDGESLPITVWRNSTPMDLSLPLKAYHDDRAEGKQYDVAPRYYVFAGLVFVPLSVDYLQTFGEEWDKISRSELLHYTLMQHNYEKPKQRRREPVVLSHTLPHSVNADMQIREHALVDRINGVRIECLDDVVKAFQTPQGSYDTIDFLANHHLEALDHALAVKAQSEILKTYNVPKDRNL